MKSSNPFIIKEIIIIILPVKGLPERFNIFPVSATKPPVSIAAVTCFLTNFNCINPVIMGNTNAPEKKVRAKSSDCSMELINNAIIILRLPIKTIKKRVSFSAFLSFRFS